MCGTFSNSFSFSRYSKVSWSATLHHVLYTSSLSKEAESWSAASPASDEDQHGGLHDRASPQAPRPSQEEANKRGSPAVSTVFSLASKATLTSCPLVDNKFKSVCNRYPICVWNEHFGSSINLSLKSGDQRNPTTSSYMYLLKVCSTWIDIISFSYTYTTRFTPQKVYLLVWTQTWNLSKILHDQIFGPNILHTVNRVKRDYFCQR